MTKGTASLGKMGRRSVHIRCRRCGQRAYHKQKGYCAACGYGRTAKLRHYSWAKRH